MRNGSDGRVRCVLADQSSRSGIVDDDGAGTLCDAAEHRIAEVALSWRRRRGRAKVGVRDRDAIRRS